jgi:hypothetical protein
MSLRDGCKTVYGTESPLLSASIDDGYAKFIKPPLFLVFLSGGYEYTMETALFLLSLKDRLEQYLGDIIFKYSEICSS